MFNETQHVETAKTLFRQFLKFGAVGVFNTLLFYALYLIFLNFVAPEIGYYLSYAISMISAALLNLKFTFQKQATLRKLVMFVCVYLLSMFIGGQVLSVLIGFSISAPLAGLLTIGVTIVTNFLGLKAVAKWT